MAFNNTSSAYGGQAATNGQQHAAYLRYKYSVLESPGPAQLNILFSVLALRIMAMSGGQELLSRYDWRDTSTPNGHDYAMLLELSTAGFYADAHVVEHMFANPVGQQQCGYAHNCQVAAMNAAWGVMEQSHHLIGKVVYLFTSQPHNTKAIAATRLLQCMRENNNTLAEGFGMFIVNQGLFVQTNNYG